MATADGYGLAVESLQRLRVLREIARTGSLSAAARALSMSQPSVSQHVNQLERELGVVIVERSVKGAVLTSAGEIALQHGLHMLRVADDARRELDAHAHGLPARLVVSSFSSACSGVVPPAIAAVREDIAPLDLGLSELDVDEAVDSVVQGDADVAVVFDYAAHPFDARGLDRHPLGDDPVAVVLPVDHPFAGRDVVDIAALRDESWIDGTGFGCAESLRTVCGAAGFEPSVALGSNRYPTTLALVAAGIAIALVPRTALAPLPDGLVARQLRPAAPPRRLWALTTGEPSPAATAFVAALATIVRGRTSTPPSPRARSSGGGGSAG